MSEPEQHADPIARFKEAIERARRTEPFEPDRAALATADPSGRPSVRYVLVRGYDQEGFAFYTNYESDKARDLEANPRAAIAWHWSTIGEQVRARGSVRRMSPEASDAYFAMRPHGSRVGAWASPQSRPIGSREELERRVAELDERYSGRSVERPSFWGGYLLVPDEIEFWIDRESRLHDRFLYTREGTGWRVTRLAP